MAVLDVSEATFDQEVVRRSHEAPVVVDFWAAWCGPCRALSPILERLAREANGAWVLAKVDVDANPNLAMRFGVQGIPAVRAFRDGREVAQFVGALPEPHVRDWLKKLGPSEADRAFEQAQQAERRGDLDAAARGYRRVLELDPAHDAARRAFARAALALRAASLDEQNLLRRLQEDASDVDAIVDLADLKASRGEIQAALDRLIEVVRSSSGQSRERARKHLLNLLETLPASDPRAMAARRSLSMALF